MEKESCSDCLHSGNSKAKMKTIRISKKAYENISKQPGNTSCVACEILGEYLQTKT